jgi:hypothetical protein
MPDHELTIIPRPKMDAPNLVAARCSCGAYESAPGNESNVRRSWEHHRDAKLTAETSRTRRCPLCGGDTWTPWQAGGGHAEDCPNGDAP